jgi:LPXTG-motif cell wall-anchored protein
MKKSPWIEFISAGILATSISVISMSSPAAAQVTTPSTGTDTQGTTTTTYETSNYNPGLWGLTGLLGLFGLFGRRKEDTHTTNRRDDAPVYRDPSIR